MPNNLLDPFVKGTGSVEINYAAVAGIDVAGLLRDLSHYPYGCTEQLTSVAFPQLFFDDVAVKMAAAKANAGDEIGLRQVRAGIQDALTRILDRQGSDGSFGLWTANDQSVPPFLGAYVADFILRAKERGFAIPDSAVEGVVQSLRTLTERRSAWRLWDRTIEARARIDGAAYGFYLLARLQQTDLGALRYFADNDLKNSPSALAAAQTGAALAMAGDRVRADRSFDLAERRLADARNDPQRIYYYATRVRDQAAVLTVFALAGETKRTEAILKTMIQADLRPEQLMTQEKAWLLFAAQAMSARAGALNVVANDRIPAATAPGPLSFAPAPDEIKAGYRLDNRGTGEIWRNVVVRGVPNVAPPAFGNGAGLTKSFHHLDGTQLDPASFQQNDRVVVQLNGSFTGEAYRQAILVDMLPAGWEIEGPVTVNADDQSPAYPWLNTLTRVRMREARDDRFVTAFDLNQRETYRYDDGDSNERKKRYVPLPGGTFRIAYVIRAITPGKFVLPGASVEDLYRPGVGARTQSGATEVRGR